MSNYWICLEIREAPQAV